MECLLIFSKWVESNSGQIQILIGLVALFLAVLAYFKILEQIQISNKQTNLSIDQTNITIKQMEQLKNERFFELKLRLNIRTREQQKELSSILENFNRLSTRLTCFEEDIRKNYPSSSDGVKGIIDVYRTTITNSFKFATDHFKIVKELQDTIISTKELEKMEEVFYNVEKNQKLYDGSWITIRSIDKTIDDLWIPLNATNETDMIRKIGKLGNNP